MSKEDREVPERSADEKRAFKRELTEVVPHLRHKCALAVQECNVHCMNSALAGQIRGGRTYHAWQALTGRRSP